VGPPEGDSVSDRSPTVLISYRRDDTAGHAGRIYDRLATALGSSTLFMDIEGIGAGHDFTRDIRSAVESCQVLVAVIGREWLDIRDDQGQRRLDDPNDWVRLEVATALQRDIVVIPVLVEGARMPRDRDLPPDLAPLAKRQALEISDTRFNGDVERLVTAIRGDAAPRAGAGRGPWWQRKLLWGSAAAALLVTTIVVLNRPAPLAENVTAPPVIRSFTVEPSRYIAGHIDSVRLSWDVEHGADVAIGELGSLPPRGGRTVPAPAKDTAYRLVARNAVGDVNGQASVDVITLDEFIAVDTSSPAEKQRMTAWLSDFLRALEQVGYLPDVGRVIVVVDPKLRDNAYFDRDRIVIGGPLAADRDVLLREYCHLMLTGDEFNRRTGMTVPTQGTGGAIESALADYFPASVQDDPKIGEVAGPVVWKVPYIRTLINATKFTDVSASDPPQRAGEPWAGAFWDMRLAFGRAEVDKLLLDVWFGLRPSGRTTDIGAQFVEKLLERAGASPDPGRAGRIRSILQQRQFPNLS
jgi:hypothetical protein